MLSLAITHSEGPKCCRILAVGSFDNSTRGKRNPWRQNFSWRRIKKRQSQFWFMSEKPRRRVFTPLIHFVNIAFYSLMQKFHFFDRIYYINNVLTAFLSPSLFQKKKKRKRKNKENKIPSFILTISKHIRWLVPKHTHLRHAENWNFICYPPIYHFRYSEYRKWGKILQKEKDQIHPVLFLMHPIFLVFLIFVFSIQIQNSLHLKLDLNAFKKLKKSDASEITIDESDFFLFYDETMVISNLAND